MVAVDGADDAPVPGDGDDGVLARQREQQYADDLPDGVLVQLHGRAVVAVVADEHGGDRAGTDPVRRLVYASGVSPGRAGGISGYHRPRTTLGAGSAVSVTV